MRRNVLTSITVLSLTAVATLIGACATSPVGDDLGDAPPAQEQPTETDDTSATIPAPAPAPAPDTTTDAGADDAAAKDSGTKTPKDSGTTPPPTTGGDCDPDNPKYALTLSAILLTGGSAPQCPCVAGQCCVSVTLPPLGAAELGCVNE